MGGRTAALLVVLVVAAACTSARSEDDDAGTVAVAEVLTAPMVDADGIVFSVALRNDGAEPVTVEEVVAEVDDGVVVDILGASTCRHGCAGTMGWADAQPMMERSIEWPDRFPVPADVDVIAGRADVVKVVLRVRPADVAAQRRLSSTCLFVRRLLVRVGNGPLRPLPNRHADFVVALDRPDAGLPDAPSRCPVSEWSPVPAD